MTPFEITSEICTVLMCIATLYVAFAKKSQKREVAMDPGVATKEEFDEHRVWNAADHEKIWNEIKTVERAAKMELDRKIAESVKEHNESRARLHARVDEVLTVVSAVEGKVEILIDRMT